MKKIISTSIMTLIFLTIALGVAYYALFRPYENINPDEQITFQNIEPSDSGIYPVSVRNVDSMQEKIIILGTSAVSLVVIALNMTTTATASRQVTDVNIVKVSDRFIGPSVPESLQK
jgi:hypothetical protein